jgi:hypothetical protein
MREGGNKNVMLKKRRQPVRQERRIQAAREWARSLGAGPHSRGVLNKYARANKVTALCALKDLERLGIKIDPAVAARIHDDHSRGGRVASPKSGVPDGYGEWWDDDYSFIAGHTSGGAAFGVPWENDNGNDHADSGGRARSLDPSKETDSSPAVQGDDDIPF